MKYVVICYAIHGKKIVEYKSFDNKEDALLFLEQSTWDLSFVGDATVNDNGTAYLVSDEGKDEWTWEIITI